MNSLKNFLLLVPLVTLISCSDEFLEEKPNKSLTTPATLADYWSLLDNRDIMQLTPGLGQLSSDDHYFLEPYWEARGPVERNSYIWAADIYQGSNGPDWQTCYQQVYYSNCVLEGIEGLDIDPGSQTEWNSLKGSALFMRAYAFYNLAETFAKPFSSSTGSDPGIPIRLSTDLSIKSVRASLQQTYGQIFEDLLAAKNLLPATIQGNHTRPSKPAAMALLSRVYLSVGDFERALNYADSTLNIHNRLLDYNTVDRLSNSPFNTKDNPEVLYESCLFNWGSLFNRSNTLTDTLLLASYSEDDLRRSIFFRTNASGQLYFKGRYTMGLQLLFSGLATDEVYLIRAECLARSGKAQQALDDLNLLLVNRWQKAEDGSSKFVPFVGSDASAALDLILKERRKELIFRGIRWSDLRRLNREPELQVTLHRVLNGLQYTLEPNSNRYVFPIPPEEIAISGIEQNER